jgi:hypothetical protein
MVGERDRDSDPPRRPDFVMIVRGLSETAIKRWWADRQRSWPQWDAASNNCATTVALALQAGGAHQYEHALDWWRANNFVWAPSDIIAYVRVINTGFDRSLLQPESGSVGRIADWL